MILLSKLKGYKGEELDVIHEVAAFAGEAVEFDDGLILPPYPTHLPDLFVLDDVGTNSHFMKHKPSCNGRSMANNKHEGKETTSRTDESAGKKTSKGIRQIIGLFAKSAITLLTVMSMLSFAGYQPMFRKKPSGRQISFQCPQGKSLVIEDGEARCVVKERVEIPFESDVTNPNIRYGFG